MKLDEYSMTKLWDLMTMIYKWQLSVATNQNIFDITRRHLKNVARLLPHYFPKSFIEQTLIRFQNLKQRFTDDDYKCLINTLILWFSEYHTKISVLLRLGLQKKDGTFSLPATINPKILHNLGENIYIYDSKKNPVEDFERSCSDTSEINCLLASIEKEKNISKQGILKIQLPIELGNQQNKKGTLELARDTMFENIATNFKCSTNDLSFNPNLPKSPQEDLLKMLDES